MNSFSYGNVGWQFFVYATYLIVGLSLFIYTFLAVKSKNKALKNLVEEGFIQLKNEPKI